jgi:hypothetical protein
MPTIHKWSPITDLGDNPKSLTDGELESLRRIWADQKNDLTQRGVLGEFDKRLRREWSIETGIIENVYTLNPGVTRTLIEKGIDATLIPHGASDRDSTLVARIIQDHYDALEGMFNFVGGQRQLSTSYVKELHAALLRNQDTIRWSISSVKLLRNNSKEVNTSRRPTARRGQTGLCTNMLRQSTSPRKWIDC